MRLLVKDSYDDGVAAYEISSAFMTDTVPVHDADTWEEIGVVQFPAAAVFNAAGNNSDEIYIVSNSADSIAKLLTSIVEQGYLDATEYKDNTFISPDENDYPKLSALAKEYNPLSPF